MKCYENHEELWRQSCLYRCPGPIQFTPGVIDVKVDDLPLILRACYMSSNEFAELIQPRDETENVFKSLQNNSVFDQSKNPLEIAAAAAAQTSTRSSIMVKTRGQLTPLQLNRIQYNPQLPDVLNSYSSSSSYTFRESDITAKLSSDVLIKAFFPFTCKLKDLELVPWKAQQQDHDAHQIAHLDQQVVATAALPDPLGVPDSLSPQLLRPSNHQPLNGGIQAASFSYRSKVNQSSHCCLHSLVSIPSFPEATAAPVGKHLITAAAAAAGEAEEEEKGNNNNDEDDDDDDDDDEDYHSVLLSSADSFDSAFLIHSNHEQEQQQQLETAPAVVSRELQFESSTLSLSDRVVNSRSLASLPESSDLFSSRESKTLHSAEHASPTADAPTVPAPAAISAAPFHSIGGLESPLSSPQSLFSTFTAAGVTAVATCFVGRQAPGAMNVVWGLLHYLTKQLNPSGICYGIVGGLQGLIKQELVVLRSDVMQMYRNLGGVELLSTTRAAEQFNSDEDVKACVATATEYKLKGILMCGGLATVGIAALLSEKFRQSGCTTSVVAVPISISSGIPSIETTLGHDTSVRVFNSVIGSLMCECRSSKSWYFVKIFGPSLSHLCVECALETHPTLVLISEEVVEKNMTLISITNMISDVVELRALKGIMYGVVLLSDDLLVHLPEIRVLVEEINSIFQFSLQNDSQASVWPPSKESLSQLKCQLTPWSSSLLNSLPVKLQWQFAFSKDINNAVDLADIDIEVLLKFLVESDLNRRKSLGSFKQSGAQFVCKTHFLAFQGRSALPSKFDCDLGFSLGFAAAVLIFTGKTGYLASVSKLHKPTSQWSVNGIPLASLIRVVSVQQQQQQQKLYNNYHCSNHRFDLLLSSSSSKSSSSSSKSSSSKSSSSSSTTLISPPPFLRRSGDESIFLSNSQSNSNRNSNCDGYNYSNSDRYSCSHSDGNRITSKSRLENHLMMTTFSFYVPSIRCFQKSLTFQLIQANRLAWISSDFFCNPGPVQFDCFGQQQQHERQQRCLFSLKFCSSSANPINQLKEISRLFCEIKQICVHHSFDRPAPSIAVCQLKALVDVLKSVVGSRNSDADYGAALSAVIINSSNVNCEINRRNSSAKQRECMELSDLPRFLRENLKKEVQMMQQQQQQR